MVRFRDQDGNDIISQFNAYNNGWGQGGAATLANSGTYFVRVGWNWQWTGETS